ncbi:zinc-ribbon domain-containing protein [Primorskyibacter sp. S187A]|uniref:zinc-ribbon domain-containing protein n=1 Tax=Primorskyibacter sp. S187A TaxID=3415130 RepID=UPI003C7B049F
MRLICPNCDAQYEVPDNVIPEGGRDVQCSNCSSTWFFNPQDPLEDEEDLETVDDSAAPPPEEIEEPTTEPPAPAPDMPQRRTLDPALEEVLREEAEREARARAAEQETLETQPDLGLDDMDTADEAAKRAREARERMARIRGDTPAPPEAENAPSSPEMAPMDSSAAVAAGAVAAASVAEGTRRGLLPDIEEINSTLRADEDRSSPQSTEAKHRDDPRRKGGFGKGFIWTLAFFAVAIALYLAAPQITAALPQAAPVLEPYVATVDMARGWLDQRILNLMGALDGLSNEASANGS